MDKQIERIDQEVKKKKLKTAHKDLQDLKRKDKKRDKIVDAAKKIVKRKK